MYSKDEILKCFARVALESIVRIKKCHRPVIQHLSTVLDTSTTPVLFISNIKIDDEKTKNKQFGNDAHLVRSKLYDEAVNLLSSFINFFLHYCLFLVPLALETDN